jgi:integrase
MRFPVHVLGTRIGTIELYGSLARTPTTRTFRHTYSIMLRSTRGAINVQEEPLRHANIETTMNIYTFTRPRIRSVPP